MDLNPIVPHSEESHEANHLMQAYAAAEKVDLYSLMLQSRKNAYLLSVHEDNTFCEPFPEKRTQKVKKKWNDSRGIRYRWLCNGEAKISLKTRGGNPTQSRVRADGVVEDFQIGKDIALRRRPGWIVF